MNGAVNNFSDLKDSFFSNETLPYWTLYYGFQVKASERTASNTTAGDMDAAWQELERQVMQKCSRGGRFLLFQTDKVGSSAGFKTKIDFSPQSPTGYGHAAVSGIGAMPGMAMQQIPNGYVSKEEAEQLAKEYAARELKDYKNEQRIDVLEAALDDKEKGDGIGRALNTALEHPQVGPLLGAVTAHFLNRGQAGLVGYPPMQPQHLPQQPENNDDGDAYDTDRVGAFCDAVFETVEDGYLFLETVEWLCRTSPADVQLLYNLKTAEYLKAKDSQKNDENAPR